MSFAEGGVDFATFWSLFGTAILAALAAAVLCGVLGVFVVLRRVAFVSAALGQLSGLGVAFGYLLGSLLGRDPHTPVPLWLDPVVLALILTGAASLSMAWISRAQRAPAESVVAFGYLTATALAILVLAAPQMVQESHEVSMLLFGNAVAVSNEHLVELATVTVLVLASQAFFFKDFLLVSFDRDIARSLGLPVRSLELGLNLSIGVSVAVATRAIGALPVFGFLVLPAGAALLAFDSMRAVVLTSVIAAVVAAIGGFYLSFVESWPTGAMMVACAAAFWPLALLVRRARGARLA